MAGFLLFTLLYIYFDIKKLGLDELKRGKAWRIPLAVIILALSVLSIVIILSVRCQEPGPLSFIFFFTGAFFSLIYICASFGRSSATTGGAEGGAG